MEKENVTNKLINQYKKIEDSIIKRINEDGVIKTANSYKRIFTEKLNIITEEYKSTSGNSYQRKIPYQKYILLLNSRLKNIGPLYPEDPEYNKDWLVEMMCECHFIYYCYLQDIYNLALEQQSNYYEECRTILNI